MAKCKTDAEIAADTRIAHAWAWRTGAIEIAVLTGKSRPPKGALVIAKGPVNLIDPLISGMARHTYDGSTLLVPGVPEASDDDAAWEALMTFQRRVMEALKPDKNTIRRATGSA